MPKKNVRLSDIQLALMGALWKEGSATTVALHDQVGKPRGLAHTTISTLLTRLEKRGLIVSTKDKGERVYRPIAKSDDVKRSMVSSLVSTLFRGDPAALVSHLLEESDFDAEDLKKVRKMLTSKDQPK
jgi:BlaI family transcriptional regulator, penicillinase repressor